MFRVITADALDDELFRREIGFGDEIDVALFLDIYLPPELFEQDLTGFARGLNSKIQHNGGRRSVVGGRFGCM